MKLPIKYMGSSGMLAFLLHSCWLTVRPKVKAMAMTPTHFDQTEFFRFIPLISFRDGMNRASQLLFFTVSSCSSNQARNQAGWPQSIHLRSSNRTKSQHLRNIWLFCHIWNLFAHKQMLQFAVSLTYSYVMEPGELAS